MCCRHLQWNNTCFILELLLFTHDFNTYFLHVPLSLSQPTDVITVENSLIMLLPNVICSLNLRSVIDVKQLSIWSPTVPSSSPATTTTRIPRPRVPSSSVPRIEETREWSLLKIQWTRMVCQQDTRTLDLRKIWRQPSWLREQSLYYNPGLSFSPHSFSAGSL